LKLRSQFKYQDDDTFLMIAKINRNIWSKCQKAELYYWKSVVEKDGEPGKCEYYLDKFKKFMRSTKNKVIIDVGAGPRGILKLLEYKIGIAVDSLMKEYEMEGYSFKNQKFIHLLAEAEDMPLLDNYADYVFSTNMLDHVYNARKAFKEMVRILKPKGRLFLIVDLRDNNKTDNYHKICLTKCFFVDIAKKTNLKIVHQSADDALASSGKEAYIGVFEKLDS